MIREGFLEEVGLSLEKVGWEEGREAGCFCSVGQPGAQGERGGQMRRRLGL